jgi:multidrug efflux pump
MQTVSFPEMSSLQQRLTKVILSDPAVENLSSFIGIDGTNTTLNSGRILINLKPVADRNINASEVIRRLQPRLAEVAGITLFMQPVQDLTLENRVSRTQFQYTLEDPSADELNAYAPKMVARLRELPQLTDVATDQQVQGLRANLVFDRDTAARLGITPSAIDQTLYDAYGQREVSTIFTQLNQYHVVLEVKPAFQQNPVNLRNLFIRTGAGSSSAAAGLVAGGSATGSAATATANATAAALASTGLGGGAIASAAVFATGGQIPLSAFTHMESVAVPITVNHQGQFPVITLSFNLAPGVALGDAVAAVNRVKDQLGMPPSLQAAFQGTAQAFQASLTNEWVLILAALVTVYIVLGVLYESYILLALKVCGQDFSVISLIGIVLLIGIVNKNGIMMIDFALDAERNEGKPALDAIYQACLLRFRPILMTTMAALLGAVPLALGTGTGSELRQPLGITMIGGLLISQMLTLFTTPVIYLFFDRLARRFSRRPESGPVMEPVPAE